MNTIPYKLHKVADITQVADSKKVAGAIFFDDATETTHIYGADGTPVIYGSRKWTWSGINYTTFVEEVSVGDSVLWATNELTIIARKNTTAANIVEVTIISDRGFNTLKFIKSSSTNTWSLSSSVVEDFDDLVKKTDVVSTASTPNTVVGRDETGDVWTRGIVSEGQLYALPKSSLANSGDEDFTLQEQIEDLDEIREGAKTRMINVTYDELVALRDNGELKAGMQYRITDYMTTTVQPDTKSAGHQFDIIVTADNESTLNEVARACLHEGDTYFSDAGANLEAWELKYCIDNDTNRFAWAANSTIVHACDSSTCTINSELINGNEFITPFNFESCVWVDANGDGASYDDAGNNHDLAELIYEWGYFTDDNGNTQLCLYKSDAYLYEEEGQPDYGDKYLYRGVITVDGTDYDYWQKWDEDYKGIYICDDDFVYATTPRIVLNPENFVYGVIEYNHKGIIYYMKDEFGNECPYDFKNIQFKRKLTDGVLDEENGVDTWVYTFHAYDIENDIYEDAWRAIGKAADDGCNSLYGNIIKPYYFDYDKGENSQCYRLNGIVFLNTYEDVGGTYFECYSNSFLNGCRNNSFGNKCFDNSFGNNCFNNSFGSDCRFNSFGDNCFDNSFGDNCFDNSFGNDCYGNSFGKNCYSNTFLNDCHFNSFGNDCNGNSFGNECFDNTFGDNCYSNSLGNSCYSNSFGKNCQSNSLGNSCDSNTFGSNCDDNSFGNDCTRNSFKSSFGFNSFGNHCISNSFGDNCSHNSLGNHCISNSFGDFCGYNTFLNFCYSNTFGGSCEYNTFGNSCCYNKLLKTYYQHNSFGDGCQYINLANDETASISVQVQNYKLAQGLQGTSSSYITIEVERNRAYETKVAKNSSGEVKIYCEADLIA